MLYANRIIFGLPTSISIFINIL
uniref:Uncharacterized protein n=1 Tax=Schistosoma japonicum TaxID=6182 RepID=Q5BY92_SCHJA|nr:unknown [Schistosoma japonicum]